MNIYRFTKIKIKIISYFEQYDKSQYRYDNINLVEVVVSQDQLRIIKDNEGLI